MRNQFWRTVVSVCVLAWVFAGMVSASALSAILMVDDMEDNRIRVTVSFPGCKNEQVSSVLKYDPDKLCPVDEENDGQIEILASGSNPSVVFQVLSGGTCYIRTSDSKNLAKNTKIEDAGVNLNLDQYVAGVKPGNASSEMATGSEENKVSSGSVVSEPDIPLSEPVRESAEQEGGDTSASLFVSRDVLTQLTEGDESLFHRAFRIVGVVCAVICGAFFVIGVCCCVERGMQNKKDWEYMSRYLPNGMQDTKRSERGRRR